MKSKIDQRSPRRFSIGVPVRAMRASALSCLTALVCLAPGFLIACASSSMTSRHGASPSHGARSQRAVAGDDEIDAGEVVGGRRTSSFSRRHRRWMRDRPPSGSARTARSPPPSWRAARPAPPAGSACARAVRLLFQHQQQRQHLDGLAEPHVVGEAGPEPEPRRADGAIARRPADRAAACPAAIGPGSTRASPSGPRKAGQRLRQPRPGDGLRSSRCRRCRRRRRRRCRRRPAGASLRRTTGHRCAARRSIASNCSSVRLQSLAIDLDPLAADQGEAVGLREQLLDLGPRSASRRRASRPSGSRAAHPARAATAPCRRPWPSPAGAPGGSCASSPASARPRRRLRAPGTSFRNCSACCGRPAQRMKDLARVDHRLQPGAVLGGALDRHQQRQQALAVPARRHIPAGPCRAADAGPWPAPKAGSCRSPETRTARPRPSGSRPG